MRTYPAAGIREALGVRVQRVLIRRMVLGSIALFLVSTALVSPLGVAYAGSNTAGVQVALTPTGQTFAPGSEFNVDVMVTQPSQPFNAWDGILVYDHHALTYLPTTPDKAQLGCLMTGDCSNACGGTFLQVDPGPDSLYIITGLACFQTAISGPGQLFRLHFRASSQVQQTSVSFRSLRFANAGLVVGPVTWAPAQIGIGMPATAVDPSSSATGLRLSARPNPARGSVTLALGSDQSGEQEIAVHDISGRLVRVLARSWQAAGVRQLVWDGRDGSGSRAQPGIYLVTLRVGSHRSQSRVTLLD